MSANEVLAPPAGFRKAIPCGVKLVTVIRQEGRCKTCGEPLGAVERTQFDHVPALQLRGWDAEVGDTIPAANDPEAIHAKHSDCHLAKTTGRKGESRLNAIHGDVAEIAKLRRLSREHREFQARILSRGEPEEAPAKSKKHRWPKRSFSRGGGREKTGSRSSSSNAGDEGGRGNRRLSD